MRYFPPRHNLTSRIIASLLVILYILTLGPLNEALASVIPQTPLPAPILGSQITKFTYNEGSLQNLNYRYDASGNISRITDYRNSASQDFIYDNLNRLIQANGAYGNFSYQYDSVGNMIYKEGVGYSYGQFSGERPHALTSGTDGFSAVYDANGNMISRASETLTYDYDNRLSKLQSTSSGNTAVTLEITLNPGWNFITLPFIVNDNSVASLLSSISGKYSQVARYDPAAKKWEYYIPVYTDFPSQFSALETGKGYQIYISASSPCLLKITGRAVNTNYSISLTTGWQMIGYPSRSKARVSDALANLVKGVNYDRISRYDQTTRAFIDLASSDYLEAGQSYFIRLLKNSTWTVLPERNTTEFIYDYDGSRVKKIVNGIATVYIDDLYEKTGSAVTKHIFAGASRVCSVNTQTGSPANPQTYYYHSDHLGSSNVVTNASGVQLQLAEYKPYGSLSRNEPANPQTGSPVNYLFTGKELDSTGLYYYGARYYDPQIGRFITPDPITQNLYDPQNLNAYTYCRNNPLRYIDPTGNSAWDNTGNWWGDWSNYENKNYFIQSTNSFTLRGTSYINSFGLALSSSFSNYLRSEKQFLQNGINPILNAIKTGNWQPLWQETKLQLSQPFDRDQIISMVMMVSGGVKLAGKGEVIAYRQGKFADEMDGWPGNKVKGGEWSPEHPLTTPNFARDYGLPLENSGKPDWVIGGIVKGRYSVGKAPISHNNPKNIGGKLEIRPNSPDDDILLDWFYMTD